MGAKKQEMPEPAWAAKVREAAPSGPPTSAPPVDVPEDMAERLNLLRPFVELTLKHTGQYTGPTRGRVMSERPFGFCFLTANDGLYFIPWSNLAYWRYLSEV